MAQPASFPISPEAYLAEERSREGRFEYVNGEAYAMAGTSLAHARIVSDLNILLNQGLAGTGCEAVSSDLRIKSAETTMYTYPDVVVLCEGASFEDDQVDTLLDPIVLIEVLPPSTEAYDRGAKWAHCQTIHSLRHYLLVAQTEMRIEHYARHSGRS
jgi:Uma2 family endonuclease